MRGAQALNVGARVFRNSAVLLGGQLAERVLKLVVMAVLARTLGKSSFGLYIFVLTYVEFFHLLTDLGLQTILVREMARGPEKTDALLGAALTIKLIAAFVSAGMAVFLIGFSGAHASAAGLVAWAALGLFLSFRLSSVRQILDSIFQVRLEMRVPVALGVASELLSTLGLLAAAWWGLSLIWLLAIQNLAYLPGTWFLVRLTRGRIRLRPAWSWTTLIGLLKESYPLGLANLFTLAYVKLDILMLAAMRGDEAVGIYAAAYRLIGSLTILPTAILGSLFPLISQYARTAPEALPRIFQKSLNVLMMLALPVAVGGTVFSREIIALVYGERFADAAGVFRILSWAVAFSFLSYLLTSALNAMGRQCVYLALTAAMTVLNVGLNWMWIPRYGYMGAAVATLITECTLMLVGLRLLGGHLKNIELSPIMKCALSAGVMGVVVLFVPIGVLGKVPLAAVVYIGCLAAFRAVSREEWRAYLAAMGLGSGKAGGAVKGRESAHPAGG